MSPIRYTLVADGSSDRVLRRVINWVIEQSPEAQGRGFGGEYADMRALPQPPKELRDRMRKAVELYPCDILFVHRDAEGSRRSNLRDDRVAEIASAAGGMPVRRCVPVVPVRMTETWLLVDERAIRTAAGNPKGQVGLTLPKFRELESLPDPKRILEDMLLIASESRGRRQEQFKKTIDRRKHRVATLIKDFGGLRALPAFRAFESDTAEALRGVTSSDE